MGRSLGCETEQSTIVRSQQPGWVSGDWAMLVWNELQSCGLDRPGKEGQREPGPCCRSLSCPIHPVAGTMSVGPVSEVCVHTAPSHCLVFADFFGCMLCNQGHINWYMKSKLNM